jgi:hypothetical protein
MGNYQIVLSLLSSLDHGRELKRLVDMIIDDCDSVVNLRENVIEYRIKYSVASRDDPNGSWYLDKAVRSVSLHSHALTDTSLSSTSTSLCLRRTPRATRECLAGCRSRPGSRAVRRSGSELEHGNSS